MVIIVSVMEVVVVTGMELRLCYCSSGGIDRVVGVLTGVMIGKYLNVVILLIQDQV